MSTFRTAGTTTSTVNSQQVRTASLFRPIQILRPLSVFCLAVVSLALWQEQGGAQQLAVVVDPVTRINDVAFSPGGTRVASLTELSLKVWSVDSLRELREWEQIREFTFLSESRLVLLKSDNLGPVILEVVDVESPEAIDSWPVAAQPGSMSSRIVRSPDANSVAFVHGSSAYVYDAKTGKLRSLDIDSPLAVYFDCHNSLTVLGGTRGLADGSRTRFIPLQSRDLTKGGVVKRAVRLDETLVLLERGTPTIVDVTTGKSTEFEDVWYSRRQAGDYCFGLDEQTGILICASNSNNHLFVVDLSKINTPRRIEYQPSWTPVSVDYNHQGQIVAIGYDDGTLGLLRVDRNGIVK